nr:MAG TPA: hypothetical protein [Caudoviricetes sp.]
MKRIFYISLCRSYPFENTAGRHSKPTRRERK